MSNCVITIGMYPDKHYVYNIVSKEHLEQHIEYNKTMRPGRLLYVDGKRINNGCLRKEVLPEYDNLVDELYRKLLKEVDITYPTLPYT